MKRPRDIDNYLRHFPGLQKWLNTCVACSARGYDPELPEDIYPRPSVGAKNLRRMFEPMEVNELGLCEQCQSVGQLNQDLK